MATLDIFSNNIIGGLNAISINRAGSNSSRWIKIKSSFFFIIKKLSASDAEIVSNVLDSTNGIIIFDENGNLEVQDNDNSVLLSVPNPILSKPLNIINSISVQNTKNFTSSSNPGYSASKNMICSVPGLKWILYRSGPKFVYILYNPMHRKNVKDYYEKVKSKGLYGDSSMRNLIQNYSNSLNIVPRSSSVVATYADPTCNCFNSLNDCVNEFTGQYTNDTDTNSIGWACSCSSAKCDPSNDLTDKDTSFLLPFKKNAQELNNISNCSPQLTICKMDINAGGNVNFTDTKLSQSCGKKPNDTPTQSPTQSSRQPAESPDQPAESPDQPSESPDQPPMAQSKSNLPIIIGSSIGVLVLITILIIVYLKNK